jgi:AcrR family transcriptional regulator
MSSDPTKTPAHADTRERILDVTLRLMEQRQGQGVRLEDVARAAGVSRQAVYLHFASRTELLVATARSLDTRLRLPERLERVVTARSGIERVEALTTLWAGYIPEIYGLAKALLVTRTTDEAAAAAWADRMAALHQGCRSVVQCLADEGVLAPPWTVTTAADYFWAALAIETWEHLTIDRGWTRDQYLQTMLRTIKQALLA